MSDSNVGHNPFLRFLLLGGPDGGALNPVDRALPDPAEVRRRLTARASVVQPVSDPFKLLAELDAILGLAPTGTDR
jgi:hypothetical protein